MLGRTRQLCQMQLDITQLFLKLFLLLLKVLHIEILLSKPSSILVELDIRRLELRMSFLHGFMLNFLACHGAICIGYTSLEFICMRFLCR